MHEHFICATKKQKQQPGGLLLEPVGVPDLVGDKAAARRQDLGGNIGEAQCPGLLKKLKFRTASKHLKQRCIYISMHIIKNSCWLTDRVTGDDE